MCANFQSKRTTLNFSVQIWGNRQITCNILVLIALSAESWLETEMSWVEVDVAGWRLK